MKARYYSLYSLLYLFGTLDVLRAAQLPTTVQFDIIFPRNNSVYKPVYPFPVVFGLHNGSAAWSNKVRWSWEIQEYPKTGSPAKPIASGGWWNGLPDKEPAPHPDSYLITDPVDVLINNTGRDFRMIYDFGIMESCNETTRTVPMERELDVRLYGHVKFSLDFQSDNIPDLAEVGPCATPVGSIGIKTEVKLVDDSSACPVLAPGTQPTQSCAMPLDDTLATKVAARMLQHANCSDHTNWPNVTGLLGRCEPKRSGQGHLGGDSITFLSVTVFAVLIILCYL